MSTDIVVHLLHNLGGRSEVDRYIQEHSADGAPAVAVVKVGGGVIENDLPELASALALLQRVGMSAVVVHGAGPQLSRELAARGVDSQWRDGLRVTDSATLAAAERVFLREGACLASAIDEQGARARPITSGVFEAVAIAPESLGFVGRVVGLELSPILAALRAGYMPVVSPLGSTLQGQMLNINADDATRAIATAIRPHKILFLTETGGLLDADGQVIPAINLIEDKRRLFAGGWVTGGMARKIEQIQELLDALPEHASVSIASPSHVARELFTHSGCGTLVRRGVPIRAYDGFGDLDCARLRSLLETSIGRPLHDSFFDDAASARVLLAGDYTAVAIVIEEDGVAYLDKFAVTAQAQGVGIGASLWASLTRRFPRMYWRSRASNRANGWYVARADGMRRRGGWLAFWLGIESQRQIDACIDRAVSRRETFGAALAARDTEAVHAG